MGDVRKEFSEAVGHLHAGRHGDAERVCRGIVGEDAGCADAWHLLGITLFYRGETQGAVDAFRRAAELKPGAAEIYSNLGAGLHKLGLYEQAIAALTKAIALNPNHADSYCNAGTSMKALGRYEDAVAMYTRALHIRRDGPTYAGLSNALLQGGKVDGAVEAARSAIDVQWNYAGGHTALGAALERLNRVDEAVASYAKAAELQPGRAEHAYNLGSAQLALGEVAGALAWLRDAAQKEPTFQVARSTLLYAMHFEAGLEPQAIFEVHERWGREQAGLIARARACENEADPERRIRIGYVSPDFRQHAAATFVEPYLEGHDRGQFEVICYSDVAQGDEVTERFRGHADRWVECRGMGDEQLAERVRTDGVDILVDLAGHTANNRLAVFARKPAPITVSCVGYCDTTGLPNMDYRFTDALHDPVGVTDRWHTEKLIRLPGCMWCYTPGTDAEVGELPAVTKRRVTFGSLNVVAKYNEQVVETWARILRDVQGADLLLLTGVGRGADERLARGFEGHGVGRERVRMISRKPYEEYMRLFHEIDVHLDPFPFNGQTTTCNALWMGAATVTLEGLTHVSRVGVSLMTNMGLEDFVARSRDEYVRNAVEMGGDLDRLGVLRREMRERMRSSALMDRAGFRSAVDDAYRNAWREWCAGRGRA